ncbi:MAG: hypothetical protein ONB48_10500 [candidate division KSB1 bacterium]|nr:hypothetical protein [candidate division KSB1 bacterium]MDZ7273918.1 hypothetical protein [candidate division KSB1 bacterium]MDZ7286074.1 hypothetical protein [candidate division KSB1 bacterium]MDZ7299106.1 hypothetical protein [candidate division KSB1 bacterium]MDZ7306653.1 hypothetical protein [candidate division KSB1 bacterium]
MQTIIVGLVAGLVVGILCIFYVFLRTRSVMAASLAARKARGIVSQDPNQSDEPTSSGFMFMAIIASGSLLWGFIGAGIYHLIKNDVYFFALSAAMALMLSFWIWRSRAPYAVDKIIITFAILLGLGVLIPWMI